MSPAVRIRERIAAAVPAAANLASGPQMFAASSQLLRAILLAANLVLGARLLGPADYGLVTTAVALAAICATLVGLGSGIGMVRSSSRNKAAFSAAWGGAIQKYALSAILIALLYWPPSRLYFEASVGSRMLLLIAATELILVPSFMLCAYGLISHARYNQAAIIQVLPALGRVVAMILLSFCPNPNAEAYASVTAMVLALVAAGAIVATFTSLPRPSFQPVKRLLFPDYSWIYAGSGAATTISIEADKAVIFKLLHAADTGIYSAATRVTSAFAIPYGAIIQSRSHYIFSLGSALRSQHKEFIFRYGLAFITYGFICTAALLLLSGPIASVLGPSFHGASDLLVILGWWIPINGVKQLLGAVLTATDHAGRRLALDMTSTFIFVMSALLAIPHIGISGAALAFLVSEISCATLYAWSFIAIQAKSSGTN